MDLDHSQLVAHERGIVQVDDLDYVDEFGQLIDCLVQVPAVFYGNDDVDARYVCFLRIAGVDAFDIDGPAADKAGYVGENARLVVAKDG